VDSNIIGRKLGAYTIDSAIGRGAMGAVYRGVHVELEQPRAVKVLLPALAEDSQLVERFRREAMLAARLRHPNIVLIYDIDHVEDLHYIVMELVDGVPLSQLARRAAPLTWSRIVGILRQLASALTYAHARNVAHRDVKPANILVGDRDHVTLVDFGIARAGELAGLTMHGATIGTLAYLAPEQLGPSPGDGRSADLYALGVIAYELLTGNRPFMQSDPAALAEAQLHAPPPSPRELNPSLPVAAEAVLLRQLDKEPTRRFPSADEFVQALAESLSVRVEARPDHSTQQTRVARAPEPRTVAALPLADVRDDTPTPLPSVPRPELASPGRSRAPLLVALAVVAVIGTAAAAYFLTPDRGARPAPTPTVAAPATATNPPPTSPPAAGPPTAAPTIASAPPKPVASPPPTSVPTAAPTAVPTAPPSPAPATATTSPRPRLILDENFASNQRGWPTTPDGGVSFVDGGYKIVANAPGQFRSIGAPLRTPLRDVSVTARFRKSGGPPGGGYGIIVRDQGPPPRDGISQGGRYYVLEVGEGTQYGMWRRDNDRWADLIVFTPHPAVRPPGEQNTLVARAIGTSLTLLVNGTQVGAFNDGALTAGTVGIYVAGDFNEVIVERFTVETTDP
jgi:serine/threonine-protein kinase